jgi:hypothetical protein
VALTPLSAIFQLCHGDQFEWWKKPEYPKIATDNGQGTGKLYHLRPESSAIFCNKGPGWLIEIGTWIT